MSFSRGAGQRLRNLERIVLAPVRFRARESVGERPPAKPLLRVQGVPVPREVRRGRRGSEGGLEEPRAKLPNANRHVLELPRHLGDLHPHVIAATQTARGDRSDYEVEFGPKPRFRGVSHQIAFFVAVPAAVVVALTANGGVARVAGTAFALSVAAMFGVSSIFHRGSWSPTAARRLGRLDHAMIYALIAGTYAPIGLLVLHRDWRLPILATVWGGACLAALVKLVWAREPRWLAPATGIALGWTAVIVLPQIVGGIGLVGSLLLLAGGLAYSVGAFVYIRQRPNPAPATFGYHELFHALSIVAVACQYSTIVFFVLPRA